MTDNFSVSSEINNTKLYRIGEVCRILNIKEYVLRYWEKEFNTKTSKTSGGHRLYSKQDIDKFIKIKELLYDKKYSIAGAKKNIKEDCKNIDYMPKDILLMIKEDLKLLEQGIHETIKEYTELI